MSAKSLGSLHGERPGMTNMRPMAWVFLLIICSTSRKSTLTCTTLWLEMAIFTVPSLYIDIESKQHSGKSVICEFSSFYWEDLTLTSCLFFCVPICLVMCLVRLFISSLSACGARLSVCLPVNLCVSLLSSVWGPSYMVSGTRDNPSPEVTLSSVYMWKRGSCRPSQS